MDLELLSLAVVMVGYVGLLVWERVAPAREFPFRPLWALRGVLFFVATFVTTSYAPLLWADWFGDYAVIDATGLHPLVGAVIGMLVIEGFNYFWHRALHGNGILWRFFHQMHHSAERLDALSTMWFSPLDNVGWSFMGTLALTLLGLNVEAIIIANAGLLFLNMLSHSNIRTPQWLGYITARPEYHQLHHARGEHRGNYAVLTIFDQLFGTFDNPKEVDCEVGFYDGASDRILEMLVGRDVSEPPATKKKRSSEIAAQAV